MRGHSEPLDLWIVGPGRLGVALGHSLSAAGFVSRLTYTGRGDHPPGDSRFEMLGAVYLPAGEPFGGAPELILITVPDAAIPSVGELILTKELRPVPVLHTSGVLAADALQPLREAGFPTGSLHPLLPVTTVVDPTRFAGAWFGVEGDPAAVRMAAAVIESLRGRLLPIGARGKPLYHAAAVFASNHLVAILATAERLMGDAGVPEAEAREALGSLAMAAVENVRALGPSAALTGPVSRGDVGTVSLHLAQLSPADAELYSVLALQALLLARRQGLGDEAAATLEHTLRNPVP